MGREKGDVICSKVVPDLLYLPVTFPFPPLGSTILEPNLQTTNTQQQTCFRERQFTHRSEDCVKNDLNIWADQGNKDLNSGLSELGPESQLLPGVHVRVVRLLEHLLQLLQLEGAEGGAVASFLVLPR